MERSIWLPNICCNCYVYNFKVIPYQIVLHHCAQIISLNQMIWSSMLKTSKNNQLSWYKNSSKIFCLSAFFLVKYLNILIKTVTTLKKVFCGNPPPPTPENWNTTEQSHFWKLGRTFNPPRKKGREGGRGEGGGNWYHEIMVNF